MAWLGRLLADPEVPEEVYRLTRWELAALVAVAGLFTALALVLG
jgi:hypothetical protein